MTKQKIQEWLSGILGGLDLTSEPQFFFFICKAQMNNLFTRELISELNDITDGQVIRNPKELGKRFDLEAKEAKM